MRKKREQQLLRPHYKKIHWTRRFANAIISKLEHLLMLNEKDKATSIKTYWIRITFFNKFTILFLQLRFYNFVQQSLAAIMLTRFFLTWEHLPTWLDHWPLIFLNTIGPILLFYCNTSFKFILLQHWL